MDEAIKKALFIVPTYKDKAATKTKMANIALIEMENLAFALVRDGHKDKAREILFGDGYKMQKQIYAKGMAEFSKSISTAIDAELKEFQGVRVVDFLQSFHRDKVKSLTSKLSDKII